MSYLTQGSASANTMNMTWYVTVPLPRRSMHLKCWKVSGEFGRFVESPKQPTKCARCGKTIAQRAHKAG